MLKNNVENPLTRLEQQLPVDWDKHKKICLLNFDQVHDAKTMSELSSSKYLLVSFQKGYLIIFKIYLSSFSCLIDANFYIKIIVYL